MAETTLIPFKAFSYPYCSEKVPLSHSTKTKDLDVWGKHIAGATPRIMIEGAAVWGWGSEAKFLCVYDAKVNTTFDISESWDRITLQLHMFPCQIFEIIPKTKDSNLQSGVRARNFLKSLDKFVTSKNCLLRMRPDTKALPASSVQIEEVETTELFEGLIDEVEDGIAFVTLIDNKGDDSYIEVPCEDLQENKIECNPGNLFSFVFKKRNNWEAVELKPIKRPVITQEELDDLDKYYGDKYGDV